MWQAQRHTLYRRVISNRAGSLALIATIFLIVWLPLGRVIAGDSLKIIPHPAGVELRDGAFMLTRQTVIFTEAGSPELKRIGVLLSDGLRSQTGFALRIRDSKPGLPFGGGIRLLTNAKPTGLDAEGYELVISPEQVTIWADTPAGVFYGVQSLLQMLSPMMASDTRGSRAKEISLPAIRIVDQPTFAWRGLLLDCSRTFLPLDFLKKHVDVLSFYKMNVLQLHLTDDQGWRLEIRKYPRLTKVGSKFDPRFVGEVSGYYTQKQIRKLVRYATKRHVTLVPEIDMPAHCLSLLKSYPELSCRGGEEQYLIVPYLFQTDHDPRKEPKTPYGVLCPGNEKTFQVLEGILGEVMDLFPSKYIHIGGDECPKEYWKACPKCQARMKAEGLKNEDELQSYFAKRVAKMIEFRGREVVGWGELLEGGLAPDVTLMSWRSFEAGIAAAKLGHPVVMASKSHVFFDFGYNRTPASLVYNFDPVPPELNTAELSPLVLGGEACMWTHLARSETSIDMSIFPRVLALAEGLWTPVDRKDWDEFSVRFKLHQPVLESKGITCFEWNKGLGLPNLTCGQDGRLWLVNPDGEIFLRKDDTWELFPGKARQVTSGPDGTIWSVSPQPTTRGYALAKWSASDQKWQPIGGDVAAVQISAAPDGSLWACTDAYAVFHYTDGKWSNVIGLAREVSVGPDGTVWILTMDPGPGGYELYAASPRGRFHRVQPLGQGVHIAAAGKRQVWLSRDSGDLRFLLNGKYHNRPGEVTALTSNGDGEAWAFAASSDGTKKIVIHWDGAKWRTIGSIP